MSVTIAVPSTFDASLPFDVREPVNASPVARFSAANLSAGPAAAWGSDVGSALTLAQATASAQPNRQIVGTQPGLVFDGVNDTLTVARAGSATTSLYVVFKMAALPVGGSKAIVALGGFFFGLGSTGKGAVIGTAGSVQTATELTAGTVYAAVITVNAGVTTLEVGALTNSGTITIGALDKIHVGASSASAYFNGTVYEICLFDSTHTTPQKAAEMASLRSWWAAL